MGNLWGPGLTRIHLQKPDQLNNTLSKYSNYYKKQDKFTGNKTLNIN